MDFTAHRHYCFPCLLIKGQVTHSLPQISSECTLFLVLLNQLKSNRLDFSRNGKLFQHINRIKKKHTNNNNRNKLKPEICCCVFTCCLMYFFSLTYSITNIFSFKTAGNRAVSYVFLVTFVTEKSGAIRPGCFGWGPCHPSWRPGGKWLM